MIFIRGLGERLIKYINALNTNIIVRTKMLKLLLRKLFIFAVTKKNEYEKNKHSLISSFHYLYF